MSVVTRAVGAVVARFLDTEEVTGSNPVPPIEKHSTDDVECFFVCFVSYEFIAAKSTNQHTIG